MSKPDFKLRLKIIRLSLTVFLFAIFVSACSAAEDGSSYNNNSVNNSNNTNNTNNVTNHVCYSDEDCFSGSKCSPQGQCLELREPLEVPLGIEIYDQRLTSSLQGQLLMDIGPDNLIPDENGVITFVLPDSFHLTGEIKSNIPDTNINTMLIAYRVSSIPGKGVVSYSQNLGATNEGGINYDMELVATGGYYLQVVPLPATDAAPILRYTALREDKNIDFILGETNFVVSGFLEDEEGHPIKGAKIWGFDLETGATSTVFETSVASDATGGFMLKFTNIPTTLTIYVGPGDHGGVIPAVLFKYDENVLTNDSTDINGITGLDVGTVQLPALPAPISFGTTIYGRTKSGSIENVAGALVTFKCKVGGGTDDDGIIITQGISDSDGKVSVELIPGSFETGRIYEASVKPPLDSPFASIKKDIEVGSVSGYGESIELEPKVAVTGKVFSDRGEMLSYVTIQASPSDSVNGVNAENTAVSDYQPNTQTDSSGWFSLLLDPGYYDFTVMFDSSKEYPNTTFFDKEIYQDMTDVFDFKPDNPAMVKIKVVDTDGNPVQDLEIRAYKVDERCPVSGECEYPPSLLSRAKTDGSGIAGLIVPQ